jgi:penicillin-binding protein 1A
MPIWAYFYAKVLKDPNILGIDPNASFTKPDMLNGDFNFNDGGLTPPIGEDMGNGTPDDYIPTNIKPEDLAPESQIDTSKKRTNIPPPKNNNVPIVPPANKPGEQPKAVMPKREGK